MRGDNKEGRTVAKTTTKKVIAKRRVNQFDNFALTDRVIQLAFYRLRKTRRMLRYNNVGIVRLPKICYFNFK